MVVVVIVEELSRRREEGPVTIDGWGTGKDDEAEQVQLK